MMSVRVSCPACHAEVDVPEEGIKKTRVSKKIGQRFVIVHMTCPKCRKVVQFSVLVKEST